MPRVRRSLRAGLGALLVLLGLVATAAAYLVLATIAGAVLYVVLRALF